MDFSNYTKIKAVWKITVRDAKTEEIISETERTNVITGSGYDCFAQAYATPFVCHEVARYGWRMLLGTGAGTPTSTDASLFTDVVTSVHSGTISHINNTSFPAKLQ